MHTTPNPATAPFTLPALAAAIPSTITNPERLAGQADVAQLFVRAGVVHRRDLGPEAPLDIVRKAMNGWLRRATGALDRLHPSLAIDVKVDSEYRWNEVSLTSGAPTRFRYYVGPAIEALEDAVPGLGETVCAVLSRQSILPLWTPSNSYQRVVFSYWYGQDPDLADALDEAGQVEDAEPEEDEDDDGGITRAEIEATYPKWARSPNWSRRPNDDGPLSQERLRALVKRDDLPGRVAAAVLELDHWSECYRSILKAKRDSALTESPQPNDEDSDDDNAASNDSTFVGFGAVLMWNRDDDITVRVSQDYYELAMQEACHDETESVRIPLTRPDLLRQWLDTMRTRNRGLGALDRLLALVAEDAMYE